MKRNETKRNEMKWNEMKWNETKRNEMKWNEMKWNASFLKASFAFKTDVGILIFYISSHLYITFLLIYRNGESALGKWAGIPSSAYCM